MARLPGRRIVDTGRSILAPSGTEIFETHDLKRHYSWPAETIGSAVSLGASRDPAQIFSSRRHRTVAPQGLPVAL